MVVELVSKVDRAMARSFLSSRTERDERSNCLIWTGALSNGYGRLQKDGKMWSAHRFSYHYLVGYLHKIEPVHHMCANRACVEPTHLQKVSAAENIAEMLGRVAMEEELQDLRELLDRKDTLIAVLRGELKGYAEEYDYE